MDFCDGRGPDELHLDALKTQCTCGDVRSSGLSEAIKNECLKCCGRFLDQAKAWSPATGAELRIVTAIKLELVDIVQLLRPIQRDMLDANGKRAADHAFLVDNPDMWALFPGEIPQDVVDVLLRAREARCVCLKKAENLVEAADNQCLKCCFEHRSQIGMKVDGQTALISAAYHGDVDIARLVVRKEVKMQSDVGMTALMVAAQEGRLEVAKLLVEYEAKMTMKDGTTAMQLAARAGYLEVVQLLAPLEQKMCGGRYGITALMAAAYKGHLECVRELIQLEAKMTLPDGHTALMYAAYYNHLDIVRLLIPHEAGMHTSIGKTALIKAAEKGYVETVKLLIPLEAKIAMSSGKTALMSAAECGHTDVVQLLIGLEAGSRRSNGATATTTAVLYFRPNCFELLFANTAEQEAGPIPRVMMQAYRGDIPGLLACQNEWQTYVFGLTVLNFALLGCQRRVVQMLIRSTVLRKSVVRKTISELDRVHSDALGFLSRHRQLLQEILSGIGITTDQCKTDLLVKALIEQHRNASRVLRAICTPNASFVFQRFGKFEDEGKIVKVLKGLKHVGFSSDGETVLDLAKNQDGSVQKYLAANPLRQAQAAKAKSEAEGKVPDTKQAAWREVEAESAFSRNLLGKSREVQRESIPAQRSVPPVPEGGLKGKLGMHATSIRNAYYYVQQKLREMLAE